MDGEQHALAQRGGAGVHPRRAFGPDSGLPVLVTPVIQVVGEQVDRHAQRCHAAELRGIGQLRVLQREAVIRRRTRAQRLFHAVDRQCGGLVAVGVRVHLNTVLEGQRVAGADGFGRRVPQACRGAVVVARPAQPRRKALDRAVGHDLDAAQPHAVGAALAQRAGARHRIVRRHADQAQQRHDPHRIAGVVGGALQCCHFLVTQRGRKIGGRGHPGAHAQASEAADALGVPRQEGAVQADQRERRRHGLRALELAGGQAVFAQRDAGVRVSGAQQAGPLQRGGVHVEDVAAGVHHAHRARGADPVQVGARAAARAEVDRVEAPAGHRPVAGRQGLRGGAQRLHHGVERTRARHAPAVRIVHVEPAAVGVAPQRAGHQVGVAFDQSGHQHLVGEALVQRERPPAAQLVQAAHGQDAAVAHRHMGGFGPGGRHREDPAGGVDGGLGHGKGFLCRDQAGTAASGARAWPSTSSTRRQRTQ